MSNLIEPSEVLLFTSVIFNKSHLDFTAVKNILDQQFGVTDSFHPEFNPSLEYYSKEMGPQENLQRVLFYNFNRYARSSFVEFKIWADQIERQNSLSHRRIINIDIGLLAQEQMLLATGKPYAHRIYLSDGVYADLNYTFANKSYQTLPWTYPDYAHDEKINFFNWLRQGLF